MKKLCIPDKIKGLFSDSMWSIAGLMLMNLVAQFAVYPVWAKQLGAEVNGNVLTLIAYINIISVAIGSGANYARMRHSSTNKTTNGEYNLCLIIVSIICIPVSFVAQYATDMNLGIVDSALYLLLMIAMMWRYYADVDFRLSLDYRGFFKYYLVISLGYGVGIGLYLWIGHWPLALLIGEMAGLIYVALFGNILKSNSFEFSHNNKTVYSVIFTLIATNLILNLIFNADRLLLNALVSGTAVTLYYISSLLGKTVSLITTPLNSVIIGYTARYKGKLTMKMLLIASSLIGGTIIIATFACTIGSHILIRFLYPDEFNDAAQYFILANLSQIIYCCTNSLTTFLLCFTESKYQLYINIVYAIAFISIGIPVTVIWGLNGFVTGLVCVNIIRTGIAFLVGLRQVIINNKETVKE